MQELIISTKAFEAFNVPNGILIIENNKAYRKTGLILTILGIIALFMSPIMSEVPFKKVMTTILDYGLWYLGLVALVSGLIYLIKSLDFFKASRIIFDSEKKVIKMRRRQIPFSSIKNLHCVNHEVLGRNNLKIRFEEKGIRTPLIIAPMTNMDRIHEITKFVDSLNDLIVEDN